MFDELAEAELLEQIAQLENLLKQKEERIAELQTLIGNSTGGVKDETESLTKELKARESDLAFISKELTQRERDVQQLKELSTHLEAKLASQSGKFEQEQIELHQQAKDELWKRKSQINELESHVARLSGTVDSLQNREQELLQARDSVVAEYEARLEELSHQNGSAEAASGKARVEQLEAIAETLSTKEQLLEEAYHEIERIRHDAQDSSSRLAEQADELVEMNQFLKSAQDEIARINSELRTIQGISKQHRTDFEFELNEERSQRKRIEAEYQQELNDIDKIVQFMQGQLEEATERGEQIEGLKKRLGEEASRNDSLEAEYQEQISLLEGHLETLRIQTGQADATGQQLVEIQSRLQDEEARRLGLEREYTNQIADLEKQIDALKQFLSEAEAKAAHTGSIQDQLSAEKETHKDVEEEYLKQIAELESLSDSLRAQLEELQTTGSDSSTIQRQLNESRAGWQALEAEYQRKLEALEHQVESLQSRMEANTNEKLRGDALKQELESAQARLSEAQASSEATQKEMGHLRESIQMQTQTVDSRTISDETQFEMDDLRDELQRVQTENAELTQLVATEKKEIDLKQAKLTEIQEAAEKRESALQAESEEISHIHQEWMVVSTGHIAELEEQIKLQLEEVSRLQERVDEVEHVETELELALAKIHEQEISLQRENHVIRNLNECNQRTLNQLSHKHNAYESVRSQMEQLQASLRETEAANHNLQARTAVLEEELKNARTSIEKASADVQYAAVPESGIESPEQQQQFERGLSEAETDLAQSIQHAETLEQVLEDAQAAHKSLRLEKEQLEQELAAEKANFEEMSRRDLQHREEIEDLYFRLNESPLEAEQASKQFALSNHEESNAGMADDMQAQIDAGQSDLQQQTHQLQEIEERHGEMAEQLNQLDTDRASFEMEIRKKQSEIDSLRNEIIPSLERERDMLQGELSHERKKTQKLSLDHESNEKQIHDLKSEVLSTEEHMSLLIAQAEDESRAAQNKLYEQMISLETQLEDSREELSGRETEVIESLEQQDVLTEELNQANERTEALGEMLDSQKEELERLTQIEVPEALNARDKYRNERDDVSEELQRAYGEKEHAQEEVQRLTNALEGSSSSALGFEQRLQDKERDYEDQVEELEHAQRHLRLVREEQLEERDQVEGIRNRHIYVHAAAVALIAALGLYLIRQPQAQPDQPVIIQELARVNDAPPPSAPQPPMDEEEDVSEPDTGSAGTRERPEPEVSSPASQPGPGTGAEGQEQVAARPTDTPGESTGAEDIQELEPYRELQQIVRGEATEISGEPVVEEPEEESRPIPILSALTPVVSTEPEPARKMYTIKKGESLWVICERELGNPMLWKDVAKANDLSVRDVKRLRPGNQINLSINK